MLKKLKQGWNQSTGLIDKVLTKSTSTNQPVHMNLLAVP